MYLLPPSDRYLAQQCKRVYTDYQLVIEGIELRLDEVNGSLVLSIAGTDPKSWADIITDVRAIGIRYEDDIGIVPAGFWDVATDIYKWLAFKLDKADFPRLVLTGHSLGGSVALLVAAQIVEAAYHDGYMSPELSFLACRTFGAAKCGRLSLLLGTNTIMFDHCGDPVPTIPPHHRRSVVERRLVGENQHSWLPLSIKNHSIDRYIDITPA